MLSEQGEAGERPVAPAHWSFLPCVAVNRDGVVGVSWYDTRGLPVKRAGWNVRFRASADGGATWSPSVRVSDASTLWTPEVRARYADPGEERGLWGHPGHTAGLAADARGDFHALWVDGRTGVRQVFTAPIAVRP